MLLIGCRSCIYKGHNELRDRKARFLTICQERGNTVLGQSLF